jgi:hypothetical protein
MMMISHDYNGAEKVPSPGDVTAQSIVLVVMLV